MTRFHPLWAFCDHGPNGTGEPLAFLLRRGNAGSNAVTDHITVVRAALAQLPGRRRPGKNVLIRIDAAWTQTLALAGHPARRWEPKRLRLRLFTVPATLARSGRRRLLHLATHHPWAATVTDAITRLRNLAGPAPAPG